MRFVYIFLIAVLLLSAGLLSAIAQEDDDYGAQAQALTRTFSGELKEALMTALTDEGPVQALEVCHERAAPIAMGAAADTGWTLRRTALKTRNPDNKPNGWEGQVLEKFEQQKAAGVPVEDLEMIGLDGNLVRYMKAIPTADMCLICHGSDIAPEITESLMKLYPEDEATGFAVGDIRGAFTLSKPIAVFYE
ncbi:MAG: DUF3365 domain-containing protein [Rhodospirillales bacterium]|nr:DUF3365 domain-containing protein [Rhodospirillales bacterium]